MAHSGKGSLDIVLALCSFLNERLRFDGYKLAQFFIRNCIYGLVEESSFRMR